MYIIDEKKRKIDALINGKSVSSKSFSNAASFSSLTDRLCCPFQVRMAGSHREKTYSYYISSFVCLSVKAVHFELVSNYVSKAFITVFKRFAFHRGVSICMYSDSGTNFRGVNHELHKHFPRLLNLLKYKLLWVMIECNGSLIPLLYSILEACEKLVQKVWKLYWKN